MKKTTKTTVTEYDEDGRMVKQTETVIEEDSNDEEEYQKRILRDLVKKDSDKPWVKSMEPYYCPPPTCKD